MSHVAQAVAHLKQAAQDAAEQAAHKAIEYGYHELEAHGWDLDAAAPLPNGFVGRAVYKQMQAKRDFLSSITTWTKPVIRHGEPNIRKPSDMGVTNRLFQARELAGASYDAFVSKLEAKIGEHDACELLVEGSWGFSVLLVTLPCGTLQRWKTQMIVNCSSLGKLFNQWPTRLMK